MMRHHLTPWRAPCSGGATKRRPHELGHELVVEVVPFGIINACYGPLKRNMASDLR
jgi:hypothetical protein